jgi:hypothetical protein
MIRRYSNVDDTVFVAKRRDLGWLIFRRQRDADDLSVALYYALDLLREVRLKEKARWTPDEGVIQKVDRTSKILNEVNEHLYQLVKEGVGCGHMTDSEWDEWNEHNDPDRFR